MTRLQRFGWATVCVLASVAVGCDTGDNGGMVGGSVTPPVGSEVSVHYRRDYLGLASDKPTTPMGEGMGMALGSGGILKRISDEFVVLDVHGEPGRELWIPREVILLLDVKRKAE